MWIGWSSNAAAASTMSPEDELELPPWTKYSRYGQFPYKLLLHMLLLVTLTFQAFSINIFFAPYSRAMWAAVVDIYFPTNYQSLQSDLTSPYQYYIFTQEQTVEDGNRLFTAYFSMPSVSVNEILVYTNASSTHDLPAPSVTLTNTNGATTTYSVPSLAAVNTSWPLGAGGPTSTNPTALRQFFRSMQSLSFSFPLISYGNNDNLKAETAVCYQWSLSFLYDLSSTGQILVTCTADMIGRCDPLQTSTLLYICALLVAALSGCYQLLLVKASARRLVILHDIQESVRCAQGWASNHTVAAQLPPSSTSSSNNAGAGGATGGEARQGPGPSGSAARRLLPGQGPTRWSALSSSGSSSSDPSSYRLLPGDSDHGPSPSSSSSTPRATHPSSEPFARAGHLLGSSIGQWGGTATTSVVRGSSGHGPVSISNSSSADGDYSAAAAALAAGSAESAPSAGGGSRPSLSSAHAQSSRLRADSEASLLSTASDFGATATTLRRALDSLTVSQILGVLNVWFFLSSAGNAAALLYSCRVVFFREDIATSQYLKNGLGVACLLSWFGAVQYLEFFPRYYLMISILKKTTPRVSRFLLGVLPLFVGYALLGMVAFGDQVDQFGDVTQTLRTLFSVVNGDIIYQTFKAVEFMGLGGQCYLYVYILVFTYVVLMTIIAIVEEAFFEASGTGDGRENERPRGGALPLDPAPPRGNNPHPPSRPSRPPSGDFFGAGTAAAGGGGAGPTDRDRLDSSASVSSTSTSGKRPLPEALRLLLHAQEMVREHEDHEERRKSRSSVSGIDHHQTPFYR